MSLPSPTSDISLSSSEIKHQPDPTIQQGVIDMTERERVLKIEKRKQESANRKNQANMKRNATMSYIREQMANFKIPPRFIYDFDLTPEAKKIISDLKIAKSLKISKRQLSKSVLIQYSSRIRVIAWKIDPSDNTIHYGATIFNRKHVVDEVKSTDEKNGTLKNQSEHQTRSVHFDREAHMKTALQRLIEKPVIIQLPSNKYLTNNQITCCITNQWLFKHGATSRISTNSPIPHGLPEVVFQNKDKIVEPVLPADYNYNAKVAQYIKFLEKKVKKFEDWHRRLLMQN